MNNQQPVYPYIPNSTLQAKAYLLKQLELKNVEEVFSAIPQEMKLNRDLDLPAPILSELMLERHIQQILNKNRSANELVSFLGSGCYQHYVPVICDEINHRNEFLTAYSGKPYEDHGRYQALFEYQSLMAELLNMDVVNLPTYDGLQASASSMRMAAQITGRKQFLISGSIHPEKASKFEEYNGALYEMIYIPFDPQTGETDLSALKNQISDKTAAIYIETPNFFGVLESHASEISQLAHDHGAMSIISSDPISLGVFMPPADLGADIVCGDIQSLGMHMQFGGGQAGFMATKNDPRFVLRFPNRIYGLVPTIVEGENGFGEIAFDRTSFIAREQGNEWVGTMANLWAITAAVYLSVMGPNGLREVDDLIDQNVRYALSKIAEIPTVQVSFSGSEHFREAVIDFSASRMSVKLINEELLSRGIQGGYDISGKFEGLTNHAVYCFTEIQTKETIDKLVAALKEILK